jgi:CRISPR-associated protein Csb2
VDFAAAPASLDEEERTPGGLELFTPGARGGITLRVPTQGLLDQLGERHQAFTMRISRKGVDPYTRPTLFGQTRYRRAHAWQPRRHIEFGLETPDGDAFAGRWEETQTIAAWLRHAAGRALLQEELDKNWVNAFVLGHTSADDLGHRLSFVPLPSIGHAHSDGGIRRVLIAEPPGAAGAESEALDLLRVKLAGTVLGDSDGVPRAVLVPVADGSKVLPFFLRRSRNWETVTPVILHGHNAARGRISLAKTERLLRQAFDAAGFPEPLLRELAFQRAPYWAGCEAAIGIRVPRHLAPWPRVHVHVEFAEPVEGPVLVGIGRHYGIGVFAARRDD